VRVANPRSINGLTYLNENGHQIIRVMEPGRMGLQEKLRILRNHKTINPFSLYELLLGDLIGNSFMFNYGDSFRITTDPFYTARHSESTHSAQDPKAATKERPHHSERKTTVSDARHIIVHLPDSNPTQSI
jgi:hypothetical protein|tara:strand:- start:25881 stop:26273 length:393 start_codon:yes stop_codon:yes gene_type:complete